MTMDSFVPRLHDDVKPKDHQSLSSLIKANLQIHNEDNNGTPSPSFCHGDGDDDNDDATSFNLEAYLKWRKNEQQNKQKHRPQSSRPRLEGLRAQVQNAERFLQKGKRRQLIIRNRRRQQQQQDANQDETASVTTHTTVASSSSSSHGSRSRNHQTAAELVFSRPAPENQHHQQQQQQQQQQPNIAEWKAQLQRQLDRELEQQEAAAEPIDSAVALDDDGPPSVMASFLTAAMSATDESSRQQVLEAFGAWDQQQHESELSSSLHSGKGSKSPPTPPPPPQRSTGNASFGEESVEYHCYESPLHQFASQPNDKDDGILWSAAKTVAGYATSMVGHDDTSDTSVSSSSGSSEETTKGYSPSQSHERPSLVELNNHSFGEESVTMVSDRDEDDNVILTEQQLPSPQQSRLLIVVNDKTTAMDFLSAAVATTDEDERKRIVEVYHAWKEKQPSRTRINDKVGVSNVMAVASKRRKAKQLALPKLQARMRQTNQKDEMLVDKDPTSSPMEFLTAAMAVPEDDSQEQILNGYSMQMQKQHKRSTDKSINAMEMTDDYMDEHDREQILAEEGNWTGTPQQSEQSQEPSLSSAENTTDPMVFLTAIMAAPDNDAKERALVEYQAQIEQEEEEEEEEQLPSCENNTAMAFLTAAMVAPDDEAKEQVLAEYQEWTKNQGPLNNDNSNTAMAFLAAAMAAPDADAKEAVLSDYHQWVSQQETLVEENDDYGLCEVLADYEAWKINRVEKYLQDHLQDRKMQSKPASDSWKSPSGHSSDSSWGQEDAPSDDYSWGHGLRSTTTCDLTTDGTSNDDQKSCNLMSDSSDDSVEEKSRFDYSDGRKSRLQQKYEDAAIVRNKSLVFRQNQQQRLDDLQAWVKPAMADSYAWKQQLQDERGSIAIAVAGPEEIDDDASHDGDGDNLYADDKCAQSGVKRCIPRRRMVISAFLLMIFGTTFFAVVRQVLRHREPNHHSVVSIDAIAAPTEANGSNGPDLASESKHNTWTGVNMPSTPFGEKKFFLMDIPELTSELFLNYTKTNANRFYANADPLHRAEMWLHRGFERMTYKQGRTMDPKEADVFLIPAYLHWRSSLPVELDRQVAPMIEARLIDKTKPHVLLVPTTSPVWSSAIHLRPLASLLNKADVNVYSVGFERNTFWQSLSADRIIPIPHVVETSRRRLTSKDSSSAAASNSNRTENFVFYAENALSDSVAKSGCDRSMVTPLQNRSDMNVRLLPEDDDPLSARERYERMSGSEFCLVTCGNTPTTDTLAASVIAGCIPIRVGSRWDGNCEAPCHIGFGWNISPRKLETHLPFPEQIDWDSFPEVNEAAFSHDPLRTLQEVFRTTSSEDKQKLQAEMERARLSLIYGWGNPTASTQFGNVYEHIWKTMVYNIGLVEEEGW